VDTARLVVAPADPTESWSGPEFQERISLFARSENEDRFTGECGGADPKFWILRPAVVQVWFERNMLSDPLRSDSLAKAPVMHSALRVLLGGGLAMGISALVGHLMGMGGIA
jgi:hypothetical protein